MNQKREKRKTTKICCIEIVIIVIDILLHFGQITSLSNNSQYVPVLDVFCLHVQIYSPPFSTLLSALRLTHLGSTNRLPWSLAPGLGWPLEGTGWRLEGGRKVK